VILQRTRSPVTVPAQVLAAVLLALLALDNLLLPAFLGGTPVVVAGLIAAVCAAIAWLASRSFVGAGQVPLRVVGVSLLVALGLFALGGQGRLFYANTDWQVRDAVLADLAAQKWPFAYLVGTTKVILRAPLGMYLLPALAGKWHEPALLASNAVRLALVLSLGWQLFDSPARRWFALVGFIAFSGWDIVGTMLLAPLGGKVSWDHIEAWSLGFQYSSNVTMAFWVPNHALAGWTCAILFELWRRGMAPVGLFGAAVPLVAIWSPLVVMGTVPFVLIAGVTTLLRREVTWRDVALTGLALAVAIPSLWFMALDATSVGRGLRSPGILVYAAMLAFEVFPLVIPPLFSQSADPVQRVVLWAVLLSLMFAPFYQIGVSSDFQMRSTIMPLALAALALIGWMTQLAQASPVPRAALTYAVLTLLVGAVTPALEIRRAVLMRPSPAPHCSLIGVWARQTDMVAPTATYLARTAVLPAMLRNIPTTAGLHDPQQCWDHRWMEPRKF
jgi:hypothetical protein